MSSVNVAPLAALFSFPRVGAAGRALPTFEEFSPAQARVQAVADVFQELAVNVRGDGSAEESFFTVMR